MISAKLLSILVVGLGLVVRGLGIGHRLVVRFAPSDEIAAGLLRFGTDDPGADVRRTLILVSCLCAAVLALYSCSMHAAVTTDGDGRVVKVSSVRLESSLARVAVAMLVVGGEVALELRWLRCFSVGPGDSVGG